MQNIVIYYINVIKIYCVLLFIMCYLLYIVINNIQYLHEWFE